MSDIEEQNEIITPEDNETAVSLDAKDMRKKKERKPYTLSAKALEARHNALEKAKAKHAEKEKAKYYALKAKYENETIKEETPDAVEEEPKPVKKSSPILIAKKGKKIKQKVIYEESESDSSSSEEEEVIVRKKKKSNKMKFTDEEMLEKELERRLKLREEQDEFSRMEKVALQRRYKEKLAEAKRSQMSSFMFPTSEFSFKRR